MASDPNDAWQDRPSNGYDASPRRDERDNERQERPRSPRRDRSRSPARNGGGGQERREEPVENPGSNLHVSGLAKSLDRAYLEDLFSKHGKVQKVDIMHDPHTQESRGFGFVKMETPEDAQAAVDALNGQTHDGKSMTVAHARRGRARTPTPGKYHGVKAEGRPFGGGYSGGGYDRPYQPRSYDSRYSDRGPPRYDDRRYDDRRDYDRRDRYDDRRGGDYGRDRYEDRGPPPADRDYYSRSERPAERSYERRDERPRYEERSRY